MSVAAVIGYVLLAYRSFDRGIIRGGFYVLFAIISSTLFSLIYSYISLRKQKQFIQKAFGNYVSKPSHERDYQKPQIFEIGRGKTADDGFVFRYCRVYHFVGKFAPGKIIESFECLFIADDGSGFKNNGVVDKFIGDAVMAFLGRSDCRSGSCL